MKYEIYIDVFILTNCLMDFLALWITKEVMHRRAKTVRLLLGSFFAAIASALLFLVMADYIIYQIIMHFMINPLMLLFCFQTKEKRHFLEEWAVCYLVVLLLGGIMQWLYAGAAGQQHFVLCVFLAFLAGIFMLCMVEKHRKIEQKVYPVKIYNGGKELNLRAYYDSGNLLMDPFFHEPVSIIDEESIHLLMNENMPVRLIPFHSLGRENGMIQVVTLEEMLIYKRKEQIRIKPVILGIGRKELFQDAGYQMLLNEKMLRG